MLELVCKILVWLKTHLSHEVETSTHRRETRERPSKEVIWVKNGDVLYLSLPCAREKISYWNNGGGGNERTDETCNSQDTTNRRQSGEDCR